MSLEAKEKINAMESATDMSFIVLTSVHSLVNQLEKEI